MAESLIHAQTAWCPLQVPDVLQRAYDSGGRAGVVEFPLHANAGGPPVQLALLHLAVAPQWDSLRADGRLHQRLESMGLTAAAARCERNAHQRRDS